MKYVLVTGAYGGMGQETVKLLKQKGYGVIALDRNIKEKEENVYPFKVDLTNEDEIKAIKNEIKKITPELYAIIHYAGIYMLDSLFEISSNDFDKIFKINVYGVYYVNKHFQEFLHKGSKILITTSELAPLDPLPFTGIYAITKSALDKYAYSLRMEAQLLGISVSVLRAGAIKTNMLNVSTEALNVFCQKTKLYNCNAKKFKEIVDNVEAKSVSPAKIAKKSVKIIEKNNPHFAYSINRNFLLKLLNILPKRMQLFIIRRILK